MNVIVKICCYFERSVVTLKLRKEYLNTVTYNTPYTGVTNFQKETDFWPTLYSPHNVSFPLSQLARAQRQAFSPVP